MRTLIDTRPEKANKQLDRKANGWDVFSAVSSLASIVLVAVAIGVGRTPLVVAGAAGALVSGLVRLLAFAPGTIDPPTIPLSARKLKY